MSVSGADISWSMLRQVVHDFAGGNVDLAEFAPLAGGNLNTTLVLKLTDGRQAVLKITPHRIDRSYADEAAQLAAIQSAGVPTPNVLALHSGSLDRPFSYLLLEFVEGVDLNGAKARCAPEQYDTLQRDLAECVRRLHAVHGERFGRIGAEPAVDTFVGWHDCYRAQFEPAVRDIAKSNLLPVKLRKLICRVHERLDRLLTYDGPPCLLHGDLWATNLLARPGDDGSWRVVALLDPNARFGCPEAELAYLDLFHTATPMFLKAYQQERRLPTEYHQVRKPVYQLFSLLNHVRAFGPEYCKALCAQAEKVAALV
jgi:fructosamine-3-kinase